MYVFWVVFVDLEEGPRDSNSLLVGRIEMPSNRTGPRWVCFHVLCVHGVGITWNVS